MIMYHDYVTFLVMGQEVNLISDELDFGRNTVAEINNRIHYMGAESPSITTAIFAWQEVNGKELTDEEFKQVLLDNQLISGAI
jgi:hypothetical protein